MNNFIPFGRNILFKPQEKEKIIGDTSRFLLYGVVTEVGDKVEKIEKGDTIAYTQWALNSIKTADKAEYFFCKEDDDFILAVIPCEK